MLARLARDLDLDTLTVEQDDRVLVVRFCDAPVQKFGATPVAAGQCCSRTAICGGAGRRRTGDWGGE